MMACGSCVVVDAVASSSLANNRPASGRLSCFVLGRTIHRICRINPIELSEDSSDSAFMPSFFSFVVHH